MVTCACILSCEVGGRSPGLEVMVDERVRTGMDYGGYSAVL